MTKTEGMSEEKKISLITNYNLNREVHSLSFFKKVLSLQIRAWRSRHRMCTDQTPWNVLLTLSSLKPVRLTVVPRVTAVYLGNLRTGAISLNFWFCVGYFCLFVSVSCSGQRKRGRRARWAEAGQKRNKDERKKPAKKAKHEEKTETWVPPPARPCRPAGSSTTGVPASREDSILTANPWLQGERNGGAT